MKFLIATHVQHAIHHNAYYAYGPYVKEMNLWIKHTDKVIIVAPIKKVSNVDPIDLAYAHQNIRFIAIPSFDFNSTMNSLKAIFAIPIILLKLFGAMFQSTHIHLRCPGNVGLLATFVQLLFPIKKKTAKYAGNWDWNSKQPLTYRIQQLLLRNTILTHNMTALVYGDYADKTKNILPFFTASYHISDIEPVHPKLFQKDIPIKFIFVGTLTANKKPDQALEFILLLNQKKLNTELHFFGDGPMRSAIQLKIEALGLTKQIILHGNISGDALKGAYKSSHFLLLLSDSEGWPKAVAEAMWWGCIPISKPVSCVPWMLDYGNRGLLLSSNSINETVDLIQNPSNYQLMSEKAKMWAQEYSLEKFEKEISQLI